VNKGGIGVGSASIVLVFAVLCLTVFSLITFVVAGNEKALIDAEAQLVTGYYEADALAERVLAEIVTSDHIPSMAQGVRIERLGRDEYTDFDTVFFFCPISDQKALYVRLASSDGSFDILDWRMLDTDEWEFDDSLNVWTGFDD